MAKSVRSSQYTFERLDGSQSFTDSFLLPQYASSPIKSINSGSNRSFRSSFSSQNLTKELKLFNYDNSPFTPVTLGLEANEERSSFLDGFSSDDGISFKRRTYWFGLIFVTLVVILYIISSTASVALIKFMNYEGGFYFPAFNALLHKSTWPFHLVIMVIYGVRSKSWKLPTLFDLLKYAILGFFSASIDIFGMYGLNYLEGSTYTILRSGDIIFSVALSQFVLSKRFTLLHYLAVIFILTSFIINAIDAIQDQELIPIICTLVSCVFESINTILGDRLLKTKKKIQTNNKYALVTEGAFWINFFAFIFLIIPLLVTAEYSKYSDAISHLKDLEWVGEASKFSHWTFVLVVLGITFSRFVVRLTKFWIVEKRSSFSFSVLKPFRRVLSTIFLILVFHKEGFTWQKNTGMALTQAAFLLYLLASKHVSRQQEALKSDVVQRQPSPADT